MAIALADRTTTVFLCRSCDNIIEDAPPLRECSNDTCGTKFVSDERNCTQCNRPFSRKLADHGCEDCEEEVEEVEVYGNCPECNKILEPGGDADVDDAATSDGGTELAHVSCCDKWIEFDSIEQP